MIKFFVAIMIILIFAFPSFAEEEFYRVISPDDTVDRIEDVIVGRWTPLPYSISECDNWIAEWKRRSEECLYHMKEWEDIRKKVMEEAKKVKLKTTEKEET